MTAYMIASCTRRWIHKGRDCLITFKPTEQIKCRQKNKNANNYINVNGLPTQLKSYDVK